MAAILAVVLPPGASSGIAAVVRRLLRQPSRFRPVVFGPPGDGALAEIVHRPVPAATLFGDPQRRYAGRVADRLRALRPAVIEVHDAPEVASRLGGAFRPVPVLLVLHTDPPALRGAQDPATRTLLLAQVTRVATFSAAMRARLLEGVHPSMRQCTVLPPCDGAGGAAAAADALDTLRHDALRAWSRKLDEPI
jgi:hypothetical protein